MRREWLVGGVVEVLMQAPGFAQTGKRDRVQPKPLVAGRVQVILGIVPLCCLWV